MYPKLASNLSSCLSLPSVGITGLDTMPGSPYFCSIFNEGEVERRTRWLKAI
jgi:hypothetical protein